MNILHTNYIQNYSDTDLQITKLYLKIKIILSAIIILLLILSTLCFISLSKELNSMTESIKHYTYHTYNCCHYFGN